MTAPDAHDRAALPRSTPPFDAAYWDARYAGSGLVWTAEPNRFVVQECAGLRPGAALDLGCGEGRNAVWLAGRGWRVTGVDFSAVALVKAERLAAATGAAVRWLRADVLDWTPDGRYDLVLLAYLQAPPADRRRARHVAAAATAPGGSLLVVAHDAANLTGGVGGPQDPAVLWTPDEVDLPGFATARRETARRPAPAGVALDTVVRLIRDAAPGVAS